MKHTLDCDICFGAGNLIKRIERTCPSCAGKSNSSCDTCKGFGVVRLQKTVACAYCPEGHTASPRTMQVELISANSVKKSATPKMAINEVALILAMAISALASILLLVNTSNVGVVLTFFGFGFITLYFAFKSLIRESRNQGSRLTSFVYGGVLAAMMASVPPLIGLN